MDEMLKVLEDIRDELRLLRVHLRPPGVSSDIESRQLGRALRDGRESLGAARTGLLKLDKRQVARAAEQTQPSPEFVKAFDELIENSLARFLSPGNQPGVAGHQAVPAATPSDPASAPTQTAQI